MRRLGLAAVFLSASVGAARAQTSMEWRVAGVVLAAPRTFVGAGGGLTWRSRDRMGIGVTAFGGTLGGEAAGRTEGLLSFMVEPLRERGVAPYLAGGVALAFTSTELRQYLTTAIGLQMNPGLPRGWFAEAGFGGGARMSVGYAWR